jgi:hypothetical protein
MAALASVLIVNTITFGTDNHIALARHHDNTKAFENSYINVQTDTNQGQACETASGTSPISGSCTASSSNTISQGASSPCTPTMHPTVLTLILSPPNTQPGGQIEATGKLIDTCTGQGVAGATIRFTIQFPLPPGIVIIGQGIAVTATNGEFVLPIGVPFQAIAGTGTVRAQFSGQGIFGPSSATQSFSVS